MNTQVTPGDVRKLKNEKYLTNNVIIAHTINGEEIEVRMKITSEYAFFAEIEIVEEFNEVIAGHINAFIHGNDLMPAHLSFGVAKYVQKHHPCYYFSVLEVTIVKVNDENMDEFITSFMSYVKKYYEE